MSRRHRPNRRTNGIPCWPPAVMRLPAEQLDESPPDDRYVMLADLALESDSVVIYRALVAVPDGVANAAVRRRLPMPATSRLQRADGRSVWFYSWPDWQEVGA